MKTFQLKPCVCLHVILKKKAKAKYRSPDGFPIIVKERINAIVTENRKSLASGKMGSRWALRPGGERSMRCQREKKDPTQALTRTL